ncbi:TPR end-of-group domain-containing protein [Nostoc sp.]
MENLQCAITISYDKYKKRAKTDSSFDGLRGNERFQALIQ